MTLRKTVGDLGCTLLSIVRTRLELVSLEAADQKAGMLAILGMAFGALLFASLALLVFSLAVVLYFWPTEARYLALGGLALAYLLIALALVWAVRRRIYDAPPPFAATLDELRRDVATLGRLREDPEPADDESWQEEASSLPAGRRP